MTKGLNPSVYADRQPVTTVIGVGKFLQNNTSSSAIAERPRCKVGTFSPKVKDLIRETYFADACTTSPEAAPLVASVEQNPV